MSDCVKVPVEGWEIQEIDHPIDDGISIRSKGISYCVWKLEEPAVYLLLKAMIEAAPEPESAEPVVCLEISNESYRFKVANQDALIALDDGEHWLYAHPPKQEQWRPYPRFKPDDCSVDPVVVCLLDDGRIKIGSYADNYDAFIHGGGSARVTHWMPLPQPPQE